MNNLVNKKQSIGVFDSGVGGISVLRELVKIAKGTYHLPKVSKYGIVPPSEKEIISAFTENGTGTVVGYSLYNYYMSFSCAISGVFAPRVHRIVAETEDDLTSEVLRLKGIADPSKIKFEDESGAITERSWNNLSKEEQINIIAGNEVTVKGATKAAKKERKRFIITVNPESLIHATSDVEMDKIRVFVWNNMKDITPISKKVDEVLLY